jgi:DNA-binding PadR family transcriptional regulator
VRARAPAVSTTRPGKRARSTRSTRPARRTRTPLEYALMCLVARTPMTGSQIARLLTVYPLAGTGKSPGAVYPALYRLEAAGLLCRRSRRPRHFRSFGDVARWKRGYEVSEGRRFMQEFGLTHAGVVALTAWVTRPVTRREVLERPQHLLLRFSMCTGLAGPTAARKLVLQCRRVCRALAEELSDHIARHPKESSPSARLATECTLALLDARVEWARRAELELWYHAVREPELDLPPPARYVLAALEKIPEPVRSWLRWPLRDGAPPAPTGSPPPSPPPNTPPEAPPDAPSRAPKASSQAPPRGPPP